MHPGPKVSVIVATYNSGPGLARLVRSLDRQTLDQDEIETIFVDDGSTDDTWSRLQEIAVTRPHTVIGRIEHSGWPSRPRNVGTDRARGEYVFFADHDDEIFPDGLRAAHAHARTHNLDIVNPREIDTANPGHGFGSFAGDTAGPRSELGVLSLAPMMPHKLYRTAWLREHGIRFREGGRVVWEDIYFNIDAYAAARRIGTLSSTSVYRHIIGTGNASHSYLPQHEEYWRTVTDVWAHCARVLAAPEYDTDREALFVHHYADRVLRRVVMLGTAGDFDALTMALPYIRRIIATWLPLDAAAHLSVRERRTDELVRAEDFAALARYAEQTSRVVGISTATAVRWRGAELIIEAQASWTGPPSVLEPGLLAAGNPDEAAALQASAADGASDAILRVRATLDTVTAPTQQRSYGTRTDDPLGSLTVDTTTAVGLLPPGTYDVFMRNAAFGFVNTRGLRTSTKTMIGLIHGQAVVAYRTQAGMLALDYGQTVRSVINSARRDHAAARTTSGGARPAEMTLPLHDVHVQGRTRIEGTVHAAPLDAPDKPTRILEATLEGDETGARLRVALPTDPGRYQLSFDFSSRVVASPLILHVPVDGGAALARLTEQ